MIESTGRASNFKDTFPYCNRYRLHFNPEAWECCDCLEPEAMRTSCRGRPTERAGERPILPSTVLSSSIEQPTCFACTSLTADCDETTTTHKDYENLAAGLDYHCSGVPTKSFSHSGENLSLLSNQTNGNGRSSASLRTGDRSAQSAATLVCIQLKIPRQRERRKARARAEEPV